MILGIGTDLLEIGRMRELLDKEGGDRFLVRILTPEELRLAEEREGRLAEYAAGRFAAKEAVVKAIGCGIGRTVGFQDVTVLPEPGGGGRPHAKLSAAAVQRLGWDSANVRIHLSITHTREYASAYAVVERLE